MTDKVNPSINRPAEAFKTAGAIAYGGHGDSGFVVDSAEPTEISIQDGGIDQTAFNSFEQSSSTSSFDVTIDPGEAFVFGAWLAIDTQNTVTLDPSTANQIVYVGWNKDGTDDVIVGLQETFDNASGNTDMKIPLWEFETDSTGLTETSSIEDLRVIGQKIDATEVNTERLNVSGPTDIQDLEVRGRTVDIDDDGVFENSDVDGLTNFTQLDTFGSYPILNTDVSALTALSVGDSFGGYPLLNEDVSALAQLGAGNNFSGYPLLNEDVSALTALSVGDSFGGYPLLNEDVSALTELSVGDSFGGYPLLNEDVSALAQLGAGNNFSGYPLGSADLGSASVGQSEIDEGAVLDWSNEQTFSGGITGLPSPTADSDAARKKDADLLDGEDVSFTSPEDEEIIVYDAEAGEWREQDPGETLVQKFDQDVTVTVGAGGDFATLNGALEALTDQYPQYTQAEGQEGAFTAVVRLLDDFVMEEQVLVDGIHLDWIRIETTRGSGERDIQDISAGDPIPGFERAEETTFLFDDAPPTDFDVDNTNSDLDGASVVLPLDDGAADDFQAFYFRVTDLDTIPPFIPSNDFAEEPLPDGLIRETAVPIQLEDTPTEVATALQTAIDSDSEFSATISGREITVTQADGGTVQSPRTNTAKISTSTDTSGAGPGIPKQNQAIPDVTTDASNYLFDFKDEQGNQANPSLKVVRGETYEFNLNVTGDPFRITTVDGPYDPDNQYVDGISNPGAETGSWVWDVPNDAPDTLYYYSENDASKEGNISVVDEAPVQQVVSVDVSDYTVEPFRTTYLEDDFVTLQDAAGNDFYFYFNVDGNSSDPLLPGTGFEVSLPLDLRQPDDVAIELAFQISNTSDIVATASGDTVFVENLSQGPVDDATTNSDLITVNVTTQGRGGADHTKITTFVDHGFSAGDRITIRDHESGVEEFNYNGQFVVRDTNVTNDTFELKVSDNPAARFDSTRGNITPGTTPQVVSPEPVPVAADALTEQWEFFYEPAFGVARGSLPTIDCVFDMDDSDGQSYQSYYDGLCATDRGHINITPFNGFINAAGSNIYATRSSIINANDAVASGAGRMGVWAYSNSIINARRVVAENCGLVGASADTGDGFDSQGRPIGNGINATRGSLVNAEGATVGGSQSDNVYASYGGMINLDGHSATVTFSSASVNGQNIGIDGGMVTRQDGTLFDAVKDVDGNTMLQGVVASGEANLSDNVAEVATGIGATDATFMLALGIDDPNSDAEVAGALYWDDSADEYEVRIRETETDVNPNVNFDIIRVR